MTESNQEIIMRKEMKQKDIKVIILREVNWRISENTTNTYKNKQ